MQTNVALSHMISRWQIWPAIVIINTKWPKRSETEALELTHTIIFCNQVPTNIVICYNFPNYVSVLPLLFQMSP